MHEKKEFAIYHLPPFSLFSFSCIQSCTAPLFFYILIHRLILYSLPSNNFPRLFFPYLFVSSLIMAMKIWCDVDVCVGKCSWKMKTKKTRFFIFRNAFWCGVFKVVFLSIVCNGIRLIFHSKVELNIMHAHSHMNTVVRWFNPMGLLHEYERKKNSRQMMNSTHRKNITECMHVFWNRLSVLLWLGGSELVVPVKIKLHWR